MASLTITLTYTAQLGKETGCSEESTTIDGETSLSDLLDQLAKKRSSRFRELLFDGAHLQRSLIVAVDGEQIRDPGSFLLTKDHEILLMTPMAGG